MRLNLQQVQSRWEACRRAKYAASLDEASDRFLSVWGCTTNSSCKVLDARPAPDLDVRPLEPLFQDLSVQPITKDIATELASDFEDSIKLEEIKVLPEGQTCP